MGVRDAANDRGEVVSTQQPDKPKRKLRWYQFSLRSVLLVVLLVSVGLSWFSMRMHGARRQKKAVAVIRALGGAVYYDWEIGPDNRVLESEEYSQPRWLRNLLGSDFFDNVHGVLLRRGHVTDSDLEHLQYMTKIETLRLDQAAITDAGLKHLKGMTRMKRLWLPDTKITASGMRFLEGMTRIEHLKGMTKLRVLYLCEHRNHRRRTRTPKGDDGVGIPMA